MNSIGIDFQQTVTILCIGEGTGPATRVRSVGDGLRPIIPNVVSGELWGSRALDGGGQESGPGGRNANRSPDDGRLGGESAASSNQDWGAAGAPSDGPWLAEPDASRFWQGLYGRLYAFLGRIPPTSQRGYRLIAGLQALDGRAASDGVCRLAAQAGFGPPTCIAATDALLARHLSETRQGSAGESTITVISAGDTATTVCSYRMRRESLASGRIATRILARDTSPRHLPFGHAHWAGRLLVHITDLFTEPIQSGSELAMRDAALEFGSRLRRAPAGRSVTWTGPHRDKLYAPLELTYSDCASWPETSHYLAMLPDMIRDSAAALGVRSRPDLILVGGIGALWPFPVAAAASVGQVLQSGSPEEDVARGAAWWPEIESLWSDVPTLLADSPSSLAPLLSAPLPDWLSDVSAVVSSAAPAEPDNPFLPREELESPFGASAPASSTEFASLSVSAQASEASFSPFEPLGEIPESVAQMLKDSAPGQAHDFDLPVHETDAKSEDDVDLDDLPPWDPRRNEL
ncbi:MAG TPA: hypothetical protein VKT77_00995 [Chthonomonadaceae bacterium]|nr:hypothetical protein [Chthonomonadaceae bacterium]